MSVQKALRFLVASSIILSSLISYLQPAQAASSNPNAVCSGATCTVTFAYTGDYYQWSAPVTGDYTFELWGASGGGNGSAYWGTGGNGGYAKGTLALTSSQTLYIYPGQAGFQSGTSTSYNGGGFGNPSSSYGNGYTGGGATHIATTSGLLASLSSDTSSVLIVAGGGGGAGGSQGQSGYSIYAANGGAGGGTSGVAGAHSNNESSYRPGGGGGTQLAGGTTASASTASAFGRGASATSLQSDAIQGGGGGGGWYGGGAGSQAGGGGGGGSSYVGRLTNTSNIAGNSSMPNPSGGTMTGRVGDGLARITYSNSPVVVSLAIAGNASTVRKSDFVVLTATSDAAGRVTFYSNGKKIPGCINLTITVGTRTCTWKVAIQTSTTLKAYVIPASGIAAFSPEISVSVTRRTGTR